MNICKWVIIIITNIIINMFFFLAFAVGIAWCYFLGNIISCCLILLSFLYCILQQLLVVAVAAAVVKFLLQKTTKYSLVLQTIVRTYILGINMATEIRTEILKLYKCMSYQHIYTNIQMLVCEIYNNTSTSFFCLFLTSFSYLSLQNCRFLNFIILPLCTILFCCWKCFSNSITIS